MDILFYPHTNNETESKRIRREIGMNNIFVLGDRVGSSSIYIIYNIVGMVDKIDP